MRKISPFFILLIFSSLYLTQVTSISPFYLGVILSFFLFCLLVAVKPTAKKFFCNFDFFPQVVIEILFSIFILINTMINEIPPKYPLLLILSLSFYLFAFFSMNYDLNVMKKWLNIYIVITTVLLIVEMIFRFTHPKNFLWANNISNFFYKYKYSSIMFSDTNETGFFVEMFFCFIFYLNSKKIVKLSKVYILFIFFTLILTFSRAAIVGALLVLLYHFLFRRFNLYGKVFIFFSCFIFALLFFLLFKEDGSFLTKIDIFTRTWTYLNTCTLKQFLIGNGMNSSTEVIGFYGHNYVTLFFIEFGFLGFLCLILLFVSFYAVNKNTIYLIIPYLISGLSFTPYFLPYYYFFIGLIVVLEKKQLKLGVKNV